jgi:hypothetical protein
MKYAAALSTFALAATAIAAPAEIEARNPCSNNGQRQVCCTGLLECVVQVLGGNCNNAYCCNTEAPVVRGPLDVLVGAESNRLSRAPSSTLLCSTALLFEREP